MQIIEIEKTIQKPKKKSKGVLSCLKHFKEDRYNTLKIVMEQNVMIKSLTYYSIIQLRYGSMEVMGWLYGKRIDNMFYITDVNIGNCESSSGYTELDPMETVKANKEAKERGLELIGQWHCHPSFDTTPSSIDNNTLKRLRKFGIKVPIMLIVNSDNFWLGSIDKLGLCRKIPFVINSKNDNKVGLRLDNLKLDYRAEPEISPFVDMDFFYDNKESETLIGDIFHNIGDLIENFVELGLNIMFFPFVKIEKGVKWLIKKTIKRDLPDNKKLVGLTKEK